MLCCSQSLLVLLPSQTTHTSLYNHFNQFVVYFTDLIFVMYPAISPQHTHTYSLAWPTTRYHIHPTILLLSIWEKKLTWPIHYPKCLMYKISPPWLHNMQKCLAPCFRSCYKSPKCNSFSTVRWTQRVVPGTGHWVLSVSFQCLSY